MNSGLKVSPNMSSATGYASGCRTSPAGSEHMKPPAGPKPEPVKVNGVPMIAEKGVSKK